MFAEFPETNNQDNHTFSVSELNFKVKSLLEIHLPLIWIEGEISNLSKPSSGHWYFTLKDEKAQVKCAMFKGRNSRLKFTPQSGDHVKLRAKVSLYEGRGDYQLIAEHMEEAGFGLLQRRFDELKAKLYGQGLFDEGFKKPIPAMPKHIGVITSPSGAAVQDVVSVLKRRFPQAPVTIFASPVQGEEAPEQLIKAIASADAHNKVDVIILTRGGGSIEDLWAFNNEPLARAIYAADTPIVSAVGHEIDFTIADFVADLRAPTPSAAAEIVCPNVQELQARIASLEDKLISSIGNALEAKRTQLTLTKLKIKHPLDSIYQWMQKVDQLESVMVKAISNRLLLSKNQLKNNNERLFQATPIKHVRQKIQETEMLQRRLKQSIARMISTKKMQLAHQAHILDAASPLSIMSRGYAIATNSSNNIIQSIHNVSPDEVLNLRVQDGNIETKVVKTEKANDETQ